MRFGAVAVNAPVHSGGTAYQAIDRARWAGGETTFPGPVFHYHIPNELDGRLEPGQLVEVPFGAKHVQGIVVGLDDVAPVPETRPIERLVFDEPVLTALQLELGLWLSEYYLASLVDCFRLMLPPGLLRQPHSVFRRHPQVPVPKGLSSVQQQVIALLDRYGALSLTQIARRIGRERASRALGALVRKGLLVRTSDLAAPRAHPKRVNFVRLSASPPQVEGIRPLLGHPSKQAAVLQALLGEDDPLPTVEKILARAGAAASTLSLLADKGWVRVSPGRSLVQTLPAAGRVDLGRAPRQRAVIEYLASKAVPIEQNELLRDTGSSAAHLRALAERGLIQVIAEPPVVFLCLDGAQARAQVVELRGATRQHRVLDYMLSRPSGEWTWVSWVYAETGCTLDDLHALEAYGVIELAEQEVWRDPLRGRAFVEESPPNLTPDQERIWGEIVPCLMQEGKSCTFLIHGVTGSGKTEIYMRAAEAVLRQGRQAIVLVPEISLTPQILRRFASRFPDGLGIIHSGLSDGERYDTWRRVRAGQIRLIIGPRSALFAPLERVGLIVLDEEHDASYKQSDLMPSYHARDVALRAAQMHGATVLLGSATPDLVTFYRAQVGDLHLLELPQRVLGRHAGADEVQVTETLPSVRIVDMRQELRVGNRSIFSRALQEDLRRTLSVNEQAILFLNRRGASTFVMCRDCGMVVRCPRCDVPLTFHLHGGNLNCHHCNHQQQVPQTCPACSSHRIKHFGVGTQRVEEAVYELLPDARVLRWDRDATKEKGSHEVLLDRFASHQADILIGTQMIAKGLDLPLVTLVGVITADTALNLPDFRAAERTFQLLVQVAGRAGRGSRGGNVIVQTYAPEHYAICAAARHDYGAFYARECAFRQRLGYPPFSRLARLVYSDTHAAHCRQEAFVLFEILRDATQKHQIKDVHLIGPAPCFLSRLRGRWRWQVILRADDPHDLLKYVVLPPGWRLDIDPLDVL